MKITYSKPSLDIRRESMLRHLEEEKSFRKQAATYQKLKNAKKRKACIVCGNKLRGENFLHRTLPFIICARCKHVQLAVLPPKDYLSNYGFHQIYPKLSVKDYNDRKKRIYQPKLEWILKTLKDLGQKSDALKKKRWFEFGSGAGYFLSVLKDFGIKNFNGCDGDSKLAQIGNQVLRGGRIGVEERGISESIQDYPADIYSAFYVLEHVEDAHQFFLNLKKLPRGTIFIFAVPVFSFATVLDNAFHQNYARHLDGIVHTQLYSDESIRYAMKLAGYDIKGVWVFGQDVDDLIRYLRHRIAGAHSKQIEEEMVKAIYNIQDDLQHVLDKAMLSDQRHVLAIKR